MIVGINGRLRQGKGVFMTMLALAVADQGGHVLSNYTLKTPNAEKIEFYDLVKLLQRGRQEPQKLICIDEIYGWLESRVSSSKVNRFASYFLFQSAKLGYDLIYTAQLNMSVDNRLRELSDVRLYAEKLEDRFRYHVLDATVTDDDVPSGRTFDLPFQAAALFWDRYDTFEAVAPVGMSELFVEMEKFEPERMNATVDRQATLMLQRQELLGQPPRLDRASVTNALLLLGESTAFAAFVGARLRLLLQQTCTQSQQQPTSQPDHSDTTSQSGFPRQLLATR